MTNNLPYIPGQGLQGTMPPYEVLHPSDYVSGEIWLETPVSVTGGIGGLYYPYPGAAFGAGQLQIPGQYTMFTLRPATHLKNRLLYGYAFAVEATGGSDAAVSVEVRVYSPYNNVPTVYPLSFVVGVTNQASLSTIFYQGAGVDSLGISINPSAVSFTPGGYTYNEPTSAILQPVRLFNSDIDRIEVVNTVYNKNVSSAACHIFVACRSN